MGEEISFPFNAEARLGVRSRGRWRAESVGLSGVGPTGLGKEPDVVDSVTVALELLDERVKA
jgi:hypothetical protein